MKLSKTQLAVVALIATNIIWGSAFPIYKWSLGNVEPFTLVFLRFFGAACILLPFVGHNLKIHRQDWGTLIALSLAGSTLAVVFWLMGLQSSDSINAPIIASTGPILLLFFAYFFLHEKLKKKTIVGTIISLVGVLLIVARPLFDGSVGGSIVGNLFFLLATICGISHGILLKRIAHKYHLLTITFWSFVIGAFTILPMTLYESMSLGFLAKLDLQGTIGILYATIFASAIAYSCFTYGIKHIKINETAIFAYIEPIVAALIALPLLHEEITLTYLAGAVLVFLGIYVAEKRSKIHPYHKLKHI